MNFLVTGGAGFIGSHVVNKLLDVGSVTIYDSYQVYKPPIQEWFVENVQYRQQLLGDATVTRGSTLDAAHLYSVVKITKPGVIVHLAALPIANLAQRSPEEAFDNIVVGTNNLLGVLQDLDYKGLLIYISSSMVYGSFANDPIQEDDLTRPRGMYGGAKLAGEVLVKSYAAANPFSYIVIRPSAVYGPSDNNLRVVQVFLQNAMTGKPATIYTGNDMRMDFTYVEDAAEGIFLAATSRACMWNNTFNITRGRARTLWELVDCISSHYPNFYADVQEDPNKYRPKRGALDIQRACRVLGYAPQIDLLTGVTKYLEYMHSWNPSFKR